MEGIRLLVCLLSTGSKASFCVRLLTLLRAVVVIFQHKYFDARMISFLLLCFEKRRRGSKCDRNRVTGSKKLICFHLFR